MTTSPLAGLTMIERGLKLAGKIAAIRGANHGVVIAGNFADLHFTGDYPLPA